MPKHQSENISHFLQITESPALNYSTSKLCHKTLCSLSSNTSNSLNNLGLWVRCRVWGFGQALDLIYGFSGISMPPFGLEPYSPNCTRLYVSRVPMDVDANQACMLVSCFMLLPSESQVWCCLFAFASCVSAVLCVGPFLVRSALRHHGPEGQDAAGCNSSGFRIVSCLGCIIYIFFFR